MLLVEQDKQFIVAGINGLPDFFMVTQPVELYIVCLH